MSSATSCKQCGCSEIDTDPARGDAVCTNCGFVLEDSIIVSEVTFEEDGHGGASAVGQFVSADSRGGGGLGSGSGNFHTGVAKESREITLRAAKKRITDVAQQLRLNQHCVDVAFNFFKMALHKQLTKGRRHPLTIAACVYMTCRIEGTPHLLIDFSDVVQMDVYALGRAYLQISRSLFINIPAVDPCMYILRFAHKFKLGDKTHEVAMTALRLVQRMKRDWIHLGRRPSGLCGAALLIAARLHGFSRTIHDIINVVKVHETTLRKRLIEFGETPSSSLTLEEFMSVDLEEEHDPPSFKAARVKDREQLQQLLDGGMGAEMSDIQQKIEEELGKRREKALASKALGKELALYDPSIREEEDTSRFIMESTMSTISDFVPDSGITGTANNKVKTEIKSEIKTEIKSESIKVDIDRILMPPPPKPMGLDDFELASCKGELAEDESEDESETATDDGDSGDLDLTGIDDDEIDGYLMNKAEAERKRVMWERINNDYIVSQAKKKEQLAQDIKDGKFDKKKRIKKEKHVPNKDRFLVKNANEAIKIMLDKKMSAKINYDVLKRLTEQTGGMGGLLGGSEPDPDAEDCKDGTTIVTVIESGPIVPRRNRKSIKDEPGTSGSTSKKLRVDDLSSYNAHLMSGNSKSKSIILKPRKVERDLEEAVSKVEVVVEPEVVIESGPVLISQPLPVHYDEDEHIDEEDDEDVGLSARELLTQFRGEEEPSYDDYYD